MRQFVLYLVLSLCLSVLAVTSVVAQSINPETTVVVTANRLSQPIDEVGSSISVISNQEIEQSQKELVSDILRGEPGVNVVRSGGVGGNTAVFLRGANSEHTLVLIDGIEVNNPAVTNRAFNFGTLSLDNVDHIEILRGPQSVLYGSDALGGVINIITKRGCGDMQGKFSFQGGSYDTFSENAGLSGGTEKFEYSLSASRYDTGGVSAASFEDGNKEHDGVGESSLSSRMGGVLNDNLRADFFLRYQHTNSDLDNGGGMFADDPNRRIRDRELFTRGQLTLESIPGELTHVLGVSWSDQRFDDDNDPDIDHLLDELRSEYKGKLLKFDLQNTWIATEKVDFVMGIETEEEQASSTYHSFSSFGPFDQDFSERSAHTHGAYLQGQVKILKDWQATAGVRVDDHSKFGTEVTYRATSSYALPEVGARLHGSVGTGFKAPSLYQLYGPYGRVDLDAEESLGADGGIEKALLDGLVTIDATYFWNRFKNLISFDPNTFIFENFDHTHTQGIETSVTVKPSESLSIRADYTYTDTRDDGTGLSLLRRARHIVGSAVSWKPASKLTLGTRVNLVGTRFDNDFSTFPATRTALPSYTTVDLNAAYELSRQWTLTARVDNLFDRKYEDVLGFGTPGLAGFLGAKFTWQ